MSFVVDASVAIKWLVEEDGSDDAAELMRLPLTAPDSWVVECVNALWKKVARKELSPDEARAGARAVQASGVTLEPTQSLAVDMLELSVRLNHPAYDCAYLALARRLNKVLVTTDHRLLARCLLPDTADLAPLVRSLHQVRHEVHEARPVYRTRKRASP